MQWSELCSTYPNQWLVLEALETHPTPDRRRQLDQIAGLERCQEGATAMKRYRVLPNQHPIRESIPAVKHLIFTYANG